MDMDVAWPTWLGGFLATLVGLQIYAIATGRSTFSQWFRRRTGSDQGDPISRPKQRVSWRWWMFAPLVGAFLSWLWVHLFTKWL